MNERNAIRLLDETFNNDFEIDRFSRFIKELFNKFHINQRSWGVWKEYQDYIDSYQQLGSYKDSSKGVIDVLVVKLKKTSSRDRARTMQRNFVAKYLGNKDKDAALVAFYGDDPQDWRFSFVKMEYQLAEVDGDVKVVKELTPAKRYSFLVGKNEPNHTCKRQLLKLIMEEEVNPSLEEIEEDFGIDNVTKEFFLEYKNLFLSLKESLEKIIEKDSYVKKEVEDKGISTVDFAKKLLGQIVFIYFLQKKGWLGVEKDKASGGFRPWGRGPKDFMRRMFDKEIVPYDNFFNDILEPLFYEALATKRDDDYYSRFNCKIPFLNGGLFEPINDYDWTGTEILLNDSVFGKILDTFDRFNFTVKEDEPLEKEVAIDPEMLGKVFENLLDVKDRKSRGAFYTPREIVHYMCQQSLINYLETNTDAPLEDIEKFIQLGDFALDLMIKEQAQIREYGKSYGIDEKRILPKSIKENYLKIDRLLKDIKIVDPAVGSGAFPVGMMNEIVKARSVLTVFFNEREQESRTNYNFKRETIENSLYGVDIDSSAVDIAKLRFWLSLIVDESDITDIQPLPNLDHKIMCGNSLLEEFEGVKLFDEELLGEIPKDNSFELEPIDREEQKLNQELHEIYTGKKENKGRSKEIKRELEKLKQKRKKMISGHKEEVLQLTLDEAVQKRKRESQRKLKELKKLQKLFFNEQSRESKRRYRGEIDQIEWELIEETLIEEGNEDAMERLEQYKKNKSKPFFLWKLYFSDVFQRENPGFDVVIANPPYLGQKGNKELFRVLKSSSLGKKFHQRRMDLYYFFFHLSLDLIRLDGIISFITTNYYLTATYADKLRKDFKNRASLLKLINFNELKIFESALGQHNMVTILCKRIDPSIIAETALTKEVGIADGTKIQDILNKNNYNTDYYCVQQEDLYDGDDLQIRITGLSEISLDPVQKVLNKIRGQGEVLHEICDLNQGIVTGADKVSKNHINKFKVDAQVGGGIFVINAEDIKKLNLNNEELDILKPWFKNSNINKWTTELKTDKRLIYYTSKRSYGPTPNLIKHFEKYKRILINRNVRSGEVTLNDYDKFVRGKKNISYVMVASAFKRGDYYCVSYARDEKIFNSPKIVAPQRTSSNIFGYNEVPWFASADVYFITPKRADIQLKYVLSLINSKLYYIWLYHMGKRKGEYLELYLKPLSQVPIKIIPVLDQKPFTNIADQILAITKDDDYPDNPEKQARVKELEKEIDKLVYKLYDLTPEEIDIVENFNKRK